MSHLVDEAEARNFVHLLDGPCPVVQTDDKPRARRMPSHSGTTVSYMEYDVVYPNEDMYLAALGSPSYMKVSTSPYGGVVGYDPLDHLYLATMASPWVVHKLATLSPPTYGERSGTQPGQIERELRFFAEITEAGRDAHRLAPLELVRWDKGRIAERTVGDMILRARGPRLSKVWGDRVLAATDPWLEPVQNVIVEEMMKRTLQGEEWR